ncbi:MAG: lactate utilization protein [Bacteroidota bacterium]|nr:lactate utilization protein [Bacteroidota bacterium]
MKISNPRERILKKIRNATQKSKGVYSQREPDLTKFVFKKSDKSLQEVFAQEFNKISGKFFFCNNEEDFADQLKQLVIANNWKHLFCSEEFLKPILDKENLQYKRSLVNFENTEVGITSCEAIVARTGTILIASGKDKSRTMSAFPPIHIVVAYENQLFYDLSDAFLYMEEKYDKNYPSMISVTSGPSRTADIEKTLVLGAHGPKEIYCFYINERKKR